MPFYGIVTPEKKFQASPIKLGKMNEQFLSSLYGKRMQTTYRRFFKLQAHFRRLAASWRWEDDGIYNQTHNVSHLRENCCSGLHLPVFPERLFHSSALALQ